jgi:undecaprenyl diphosphate synthase
MVHIGIIPDGNRRWCKRNNYKLDTLVEHWTNFLVNILTRVTQNKLKYLKEVKELSLYVCSIDNINRNDGTKLLIYELLKNINKIILKPNNYFPDKVVGNLEEIWNNVSINYIGDLNILPKDISNILDEIKNKCKGNLYKINLALAYDYNKDILNFGRNELRDYTRDQSDIDIVFRSGGEYRVSGFFPTKILYSELFFLKKLWPDVILEDFNDVIRKFYKRNRRFGK